jgi:Tfp pilus assembly protein PilF
MALKDSPESIQSHETEEPAHPQTNPNPDKPQSTDSPDDDGLDFVVTEAHNEDPEMVGGFKTSDRDNLGIESPAELMQAEAGARKEEPKRRMTPNPFYAIPDQDAQPPHTPEVASQEERPQAEKKAESPASRDKIERLSEEQLQEISRRMRAESRPADYLSDEEKQQLISAIGHNSPDVDMTGETANSHRGTGFATEPIIPPKRTKEPKPAPTDLDVGGDSPRMSKRSRGVAYFAKGYIQVTGQQELKDGDEMMIAGREYLLRHKRFSSKTIAIAVAMAAAVIVFTLGTLFSPSAEIGDGRIVGLVVDNEGHPVLTGGQVRFPELGLTCDVNGQGLFKTDPLSAGSYRLEYFNGGAVLAADYATVADDNLTTVTLKPAAPQAAAPVVENLVPGAPATIAPPPATSPTRAQTEREPSKPSTPTAASTKSAAGAGLAKLTLAANVDGAKLSLDGSVIGAGNLTYTKLKPGNHSYTVTRDGYQTVSGSVDLKADKTTDLNITLAPSAVVGKPQPRVELEYYQAAVSAMGRNDYQAAVTDLGRAIETSPSYAEAYAKRAEAYRKLNNSAAAHDDYVRAAEIFQSRNDYGQALSAFESALKGNPKSISALLGRGSLYLTRNEAIAAIADFDMVTRLDKRNLNAYIGLGRARYNQGSFDKAIKHFKDARSLDAENPVIHQYLMLSHYGQGEFKEVQKDYDKFVKCASDTQVKQMQSDPKFAPVLRVIEH